MRLDAAQLIKHLDEQAGAEFAPMYLIAGDEPLLVEEACAAVRERAKARGFERVGLTVESGFDWNSLFAEALSPSLFSPRMLYELRLSSARPGDTGAQILMQLLERRPPNTLFLIVAPKLDKAVQQTKWVQAVEAAGVLAMIWPLDPARLPGWIDARMRAAGLRPEAGVAELLAYHMEGNLLAAAQEIDKLALLFPDGAIRADDITESLSDNSRFSVYSLVDACLAGDAAAALRILGRLRSEGVEPILVLWALARETRTLARISADLAQGRSEQDVFRAHQVWMQRKALVKQALPRFRGTRPLALLLRAGRIDKMIKGRAGQPWAGDVWLELEKLTLALSGAAASRQAAS